MHFDEIVVGFRLFSAEILLGLHEHLYTGVVDLEVPLEVFSRSCDSFSQQLEGFLWCCVCLMEYLCLCNFEAILRDLVLDSLVVGFI